MAQGGLIPASCPNSACEAHGVPTRLPHCDLCGSPTGVAEPSPPPLVQLLATGADDGSLQCPNRRCEAFGLPTPLAVCDHCSAQTTPASPGGFGGSGAQLTAQPAPA